jgi:serine phosphatase RsbU (regulator of sigma subunit)/PAS domain-containing protein
VGDNLVTMTAMLGPPWSQAAALLLLVAAVATIVVLARRVQRERAAALASQHEAGTAALALQEQVAADRFRQALDSLPDLVSIQQSVRDEDGRVVDFVMEFLNHPDLPVGDHQRSELIGRRLLETLPEFEGSVVFDAMATVATTGRPASVVDSPVTVRATGESEPRYATVQIAPLGDGVIAVVRDVTERHRNILRMEQANEELAAAQHLAHIGVWRVDLGRERLILSDEAAEIVGLPEGGAVSWNPGMLLDLLDATDRARVARLIGSAEGGSFATEAQLHRADGSTRFVSVFGQVIADSEPTGPAVWGTVQDLTDQRRQELALREAHDRLEEERATVAQLQEAIVPVLPEGETIEVGATYLTAGEASLVGGDWYDAFLIGPDRLVFAVGDVAGHGLAAAALMSQLRNALRGLSFADRSGVETLVAMNRMVLHGGADEMATCILGDLVLSTGELSWVCAGHPPPLWLDPTGAAEFLDSTVTVPLGVAPMVDVPVNRRRLVPDSLVALYSDGLIERRGENLDVGLARLAEQATRIRGGHAGVQDICDALTAAMVDGRALGDDLCLLTFRVPG